MKKIFTLTILLVTSSYYLFSQNVGVGTDTPGARLEIQGETNTAATNALDVNNANGTVILRVRNDQRVGIGTTTLSERLNIGGNIRLVGANRSIGTFSNDDFHFRSNSQIRMTVKNTGRIGIGTDAPTTLLDVYADDASQSFIQARSNDGRLRFHVGPFRNYIQSSEAGSADFRDLYFGSVGGTNNHMVIKGGSGNVGIGLTSPESKLHVKSGAFRDHLIIDRTDDSGIDKVFGITPSNTGGNSARLYFSNVNGSSANDILILNDNGNVGIGVTNPQSTLDIDGEIRIRGGNPAAGRVLTSDANGNAEWEDIGALIDEVDPSWDGDADITGVIGRDGRVGVGTTSPSATAQFHSVLTTAGSNQQRAGYFRINWDGSSAQATALHGNAVKSSSETSGRSTGVYGQAGNATNRWNTGVSAVLQGSNDGAAVLAGTTQGFLDHGFSGSFQHQYVSPAGQWGIVSYSDVFFHEDQYVMGDVGIGTSDPVSSLHVKSNSWRDHLVIDRTDAISIDRIFGITQTTNNSRAQFYFAEPGNSAPYNYAFQIQEDTYGSGARVGIGLGNIEPSEALVVNGNIALSGDASGTVFARNLRTHDGASLYMEDANGNRGFRLNSTGVSIYERLAVGTADPTNAPNNGLYVNGNTGLGNTNPQGKLHISLSNVANQPVIIDKANGTGNGPLMEWYGFGETHRLQLTYNGDYVFNTDESIRNIRFAPNNVQTLMINGNGRVGVGTMAPSTELDIDGQIRIRGGNPQAGRVLTSDANGLATWEDPAVGGSSNWTEDGDNHLNNNNSGSVAINTTNLSGVQSNLVVRQTQNPLNGSNVILDNLALDLRQNATSNTQASGMKFTVGNGNAYTGTAAIIAERTGGWSQGRLHFAVNNAGASGKVDIPIYMTIDGPSGGRVGIGTLNPQYLLHVDGSAGKPGGGSWTATSDARLKENVSSFSNGLHDVLNINPVFYNYNEKSGYDSQVQYVGVIAQELKEVAPFMVGETEINGETFYDVNNSAMTYMLINAVKELNEKIAELQTENERLKTENNNVLELNERLTKLENLILENSQKEVSASN
ncbi:MAG: hypothetical protein EA412_13860 [Chitinophagaceae bacterium]|nr:MAG: hypothetical protein EA412_13860 [Chitinophagaceae bacterium]